MKRTFFKSVFLIAAILLTACQSDNNPVITIVHTNDTHSQVEPKTSKDKSQGGVVERASLIEMVKAQDPSMLYLDAGDMVQGSPYFNIYDGEVEMLAMNKQNLIASTLGNHEFDNGLDFLANMLVKADFPLISCNYLCDGTPIEKYIKRSMTFVHNGVKIGLTGVTVDPNDLIFTRNWEGITYLDPSESANKVAAELRADGCDLVILLSHVGYWDDDEYGDRKIAIASKDIDLIIGGHTHTNLENGIKLENANGKPIWITQTGAKYEPIGKISIQMKKSADKNRKYEVEDIIIEKLHAEDYDLSQYGKEMTEFIAPYKDSLQAKMATVIGQAPETMVADRPQSLLSNFTADALMELGTRAYNKKMDVGIMNVGGLRSDLDKGDVTLGTMYRIFPFENTLTILELKGEYLEKLFKSIAGKKLEGLAGVNITLETHNDKTEATKILVGGKPINPNRTYYVATIDYLAEGNDGLTALTNASKTTNTGMLLRDLMIQWVKDLTAQGKMVESRIDNRVVDL